MDTGLSIVLDGIIYLSYILKDAYIKMLASFFLLILDSIFLPFFPSFGVFLHHFFVGIREIFTHTIVLVQPYHVAHFVTFFF